MVDTPKKKPKAPVVANRGAEVSVLARYPRPAAWGTFGSAAGDAAEIAASQGPSTHWSPTTDYFRIIASTPNNAVKKKLTEIFDVSSVGEMFGALLSDVNGKDRRPKSVRRFNVFAHANPGLIGLNGRVLADGSVTLSNAAQETSGDPEAPLKGGGLDGSVVAWLDGTGKSIRDRAREAFTDDAEIVLILCNAGFGTGLSLMIDLSLSLNVSVKGWREEIGYHFDFLNGRIVNRNLTSVSLTGTQGPGYPCFVTVPQPSRGDHLLPFTATAGKPNKPTP